MYFVYSILYLVFSYNIQDTVYDIQYSGRYQSGQLDLAVNQTAYAFGGSNPSLPTRIKENTLVFSFTLYGAERDLSGSK